MWRLACARYEALSIDPLDIGIPQGHVLEVWRGGLLHEEHDRSTLPSESVPGLTHFGSRTEKCFLPDAAGLPGAVGVDDASVVQRRRWVEVVARAPEPSDHARSRAQAVGASPLEVLSSHAGELAAHIRV